MAATKTVHPLRAAGGHNTKEQSTKDVHVKKRLLSTVIKYSSERTSSHLRDGVKCLEGKGLGGRALQGQRSGRPATVTVSASDRRGQRQFLPGQLSAGPRRARHLGTRWTAYSRARVLLGGGVVL